MCTYSFLYSGCPYRDPHKNELCACILNVQSVTHCCINNGLMFSHCSNVVSVFPLLLFLVFCVSIALFLPHLFYIFFLLREFSCLIYYTQNAHKHLILCHLMRSLSAYFFISHRCSCFSYYFSCYSIVYICCQ